MTAAIPAFFAKSSALYNPVIYVLMNKQVGLRENRLPVFKPIAMPITCSLFQHPFLLFFSSVTACWALLEWEAWWRMRPQSLPARQKSRLCLKYRHFHNLDIFLSTVCLIGNNPGCGLSEVQGCLDYLTSDEWLQKQTRQPCLFSQGCWKVFFISMWIQNSCKYWYDLWTHVCGCSPWLPLLSEARLLSLKGWSYLAPLNPRNIFTEHIWYFLSYIGGSTFCTVFSKWATIYHVTQSFCHLLSWSSWIVNIVYI